MRKLSALIGVALMVLVSSAQAIYRFDNPEQYLADADQWRPWSDVLRRNALDSELLASCVADLESCPKRYRGVTHLLTKAQDLELTDQVRLVNRYINKRRYRGDRNSNPAFIDGELHRNEWRTLLDVLNRGGDCEDFATAKYFLLRELGVPADAMRVVILWDRRKRDYHAMLAVSVDGKAWFLETDDTIQKDGAMWRYDFQFSLNEVGIWDHLLEFESHGRES